MTDRTTQRTALVTGGAVRLGRAISVGVAEAGYDVIVAWSTSRDEAIETASSIEGLGRRCELVQVDLTRPEAADTLAEAASASFGRLDLLVNSAASFRSRPLLEIDADEWDAVMALNLRGPHLVVRACAPLLKACKGSVVNMTDLSVFQAWTQYPHHAVSKAALAHLTRVQARALAPQVRVNAIAPGAVLPPEEWPEERWQALASRAVLKRVGSPGDVVQAVLYLAEASFVTGHVLPVDGGRLLGPTGPPNTGDED